MKLNEPTWGIATSSGSSVRVIGSKEEATIHLDNCRTYFPIEYSQWRVVCVKLVEVKEGEENA